jgi:hypothetical protein
MTYKRESTIKQQDDRERMPPPQMRRQSLSLPLVINVG